MNCLITKGSRNKLAALQVIETNEKILSKESIKESVFSFLKESARNTYFSVKMAGKLTTFYKGKGEG